MSSHLVLGGRRSGKSEFAEALALAHPGPKTYIATSRVYDADHAARIEAHRQRREGQGWRVIEVPDPRDLQATLDQVTAGQTAGAGILLDCLSMWLNNVFLDGLEVPRLTIPNAITLVSLEVGLGLHPETKLGRDYADALGRLNQQVAKQCSTVTFIAAGLPLRLKG